MGFVAETWNLAGQHIFIRNASFCYLNLHNLVGLKPLINRSLTSAMFKDCPWGSWEQHSHPLKLLSAAVGAAMPTPLYFLHPALEGRVVECRSHGYIPPCSWQAPQSCRWRRVGNHCIQRQQQRNCRGPSAPCLCLLPSKAVPGRPGLPLGVRPGPWWRQTVSSWAGGHVLPSQKELARYAQPLGVVGGCRWACHFFLRCYNLC